MEENNDEKVGRRNALKRIAKFTLALGIGVVFANVSEKEGNSITEGKENNIAEEKGNNDDNLSNGKDYYYDYYCVQYNKLYYYDYYCVYYTKYYNCTCNL